MNNLKNAAFSLSVMFNVLGCGGMPSPEDADPMAPIASSQSAILNGDTVSDSYRTYLGLVDLPGCSGALLSNDWIITAGHCVDERSSVTASLLANSRTSDRIYKFADYNQIAKGADLALVHLASPFVVDGSSSGFRNQLYSGSPTSLVGRTVNAYGRGLNTLTTGFGMWRSAALSVSSSYSTRNELYMMPRNDRGQITWSGDSGGPDFVWDGGVPYITGIHSGSSYLCSNPSDCRGSVTSVESSNSVSAAAMRNAVLAVMSGGWDPRASSQAISVLRAEMETLRLGVLGDLNLVDWTQSARIATRMCSNRGFSAGHFSGHQDAARGIFTLQCSGPGAIWFDATQSQINAIDPFSDLAAVHWARAGRVAARLCNLRGYIGGQFTGYMGLSPRGEREFGTTCYSTGAQWFDAPASEVNTGSGAIGDINTVAWAQAARAAVSFCERRGFSGGFLNGYVGPGVYGTICQR